MLLNSTDLAELDLVSAIAQSPLTVAPDTPILSVMNQMSQTRPAKDESMEIPADRSCVLVMESGRVMGIFTERDIVRLSANEIDVENLAIQEVMITPVHTLNATYLNDIFAVLFLFRRHGIRHLPVVDDQDNLVGMISQASLRQAMKPANLLKLRRISEVMSRNVVWAQPHESVLSIAKLMAEHRVSCIVLVEIESDDRLSPIGIITERDLVQFQTLRLDLANLSAGEVMSSPLLLLDPEDSLWNAHQEMKRHRIRRLVVSWNWGKNLGLVTQSSLLSVFDPMEMYSIIESLQQTIQQLEAEKQAFEKSTQKKETQ